MSSSQVLYTLRVILAISLLLATANCSRGYSRNCGGTVINDRYVLSAAHCIEKIVPESRRKLPASHWLKRSMLQDRKLSEQNKIATKKYEQGKSVFDSHFAKYWCGKEGDEDLICCNSPTELEVTEDVSQHPNLPLLRQDICGPVCQDRIANGNNTRLFELPWMALLILRKPSFFNSFFGGTIINDRYVLTAAHCVDKHFPNYVRLGEHDLLADIDCEEYFDGENRTKICAPKPQDIPIEEIIQHPNFTRDPGPYNDIALLRLSHKADFTSDAVKPICLPIGLPQQNLNLTGKTVDVAGWGRTERGSTSNELLKATVPVLKHKKCKFWPPLSSVTHICAGGDVNGADSCGGDSGGPLTHVGDVQGSVRTLQYGIVSYGDIMCGTLDYPATNTRVGHYMKWILDNVRA